MKFEAFVNFYYFQKLQTLLSVRLIESCELDYLRTDTAQLVTDVFVRYWGWAEIDTGKPDN